MKSSAVVASVLALAMGLSACAPLLGTGGGAATPEPTGWGYVGGLTVTRPDTDVKGTEDKAIYLNERYSLSAYRIPLPNGTYTVRLHFAETYSGITAIGQRVYTVSIEGEPVLTDFDPFRAAGGERFAAVVKECTARVADGELTIEFAEKVQNPMINGIEVCTKAGPVLLITCAATEDYTDSAGRVWRKDQAFVPPTPATP